MAELGDERADPAVMGGAMMKRRGRDFLRMALLPLRMCAGKRAFATAAEAKATNSGQGTYRCPLCESFHLTGRKRPGFR